MSEKTPNVPNFANRPPLNETPDKPQRGADYAKKDSEFNRQVDQCADILLNHTVEPGTDEYMQQRIKDDVIHILMPRVLMGICNENIKNSLYL